MENKTSSWRERFGKATGYVRSGDGIGLAREMVRFLVWKSNLDKLRQSKILTSISRDATPELTESQFWAQTNWDNVRRAGWGSLQCLGPMALWAMTQGRTNDINQLIVETMQLSQREGLRGLVLGCGDMRAEHSAFTNPGCTFAEVDAYDVNEVAFEQAREITRQAGLKVNLKVADANRLNLSANTYHLIVVFHSYHHFEQVEHVAQQVNRALVPGGVFYTIDYVGPRKLQQSKRQLFYAQMMLEALPERYRHELDGQVRQRVENVPVEFLSPDEAIRSDKILPALRKHLNVVWQYNWAGLLYPLLQGIAFNFNENDPADRTLIDCLFGIDKGLCQSRLVEPDFTITLATKKV
jgi:SAM-dependent methyltransferase